ncbi:hypothetical protein BDQ12DRAFT_708732 [Crucibulum laeve]|uniref:Transmembrane protein n=1 Tax=Crucibulum laeve TaxID=68775 RepID=A0A5C3MJ51_9AGAR|nr:hypothetical protein BDQ12DRAFT_708732 [Crucibulum laeve]
MLRRYSRSVRFKDSHAPSNLSTQAANLPGSTTPGRKYTQDEQNHDDEEKRKEAMRDLVESWMDRLQLISVITTFFASTEAGLLSITTRDSLSDPMPALEQVANAGLVGALVVHTNAAIVSFLAAFFLIRYKVRVAKSEEQEVEGDKANLVESPKAMSEKDMEANEDSVITESHRTDPIPGAIKVGRTSTIDNPVWSSNPHLVQVGPFQGQPPTHLLARCHWFCIFLSALGFVLALLGIMCFAWARHPLGVSIFASICMCICLVVGGMVMLVPDVADGSKRSLIYYNEGVFE